MLNHRGGWDRDANPANDPSFKHDNDIATALNEGKLPVTKQQLLIWGARQRQQFYPGTDKHYSNFGYALLGAVIEKLTGKPYIDAVKSSLFAPLDIHGPQGSRALEGQRYPMEVKYHTIPEQNVASVFGPGEVPLQYSGENNSNFDAFGGWTMSSYDYVKL